MLKATLAAIAILGAVPAAAQDSAGGINPAAVAESDALGELAARERQAIIDGVVAHFRENPGELVEAIMAWRTQSRTPFLSDADPSWGAGDVTVVEFNDYGCAPCAGTAAAVRAAARADGSVRVVRKEYPVSGPDAVEAAVQSVSLANSPGWEAYAGKLAQSGNAGAPSRDAALAAAGARAPQGDVRAEAVRTLRETRELARRLGIARLPAVLVIAGERMKAMTGPLDASDVSEAVAELRAAR